jgi:hypothetical protein
MGLPYEQYASELRKLEAEEYTVNYQMVIIKLILFSCCFPPPLFADDSLFIMQFYFSYFLQQHLNRMRRTHTINSNKAMVDMVVLLLRIKKSMSLRIQGIIQTLAMILRDSNKNKIFINNSFLHLKNRRGAATRPQ